jgi:hypothetical protein
MSEMTWLMLLCPSNILGPKKRADVSMVWGWSGESIPRSASAYLTDEVLSGIGSAGPGFNNHRWREVEFFTNVCRAFKRLDRPERNRILSDGWIFAEWLQGIPEADVRQLRHMLLFLLFPDMFERVFGQTDRHAIVAAFTHRTIPDVKRLGPVGIDRELAKVRRTVTEELGTDQLDFYVSPLEERWKSDDVEEVPETPRGKPPTEDDGEIGALIQTFLEQATAGTSLAVRNYSRSYQELEVKVSFGQGNIARVPWMAFLAKGQSVQRGIYPVLLFFRDQHLLMLCYGVSQTNIPGMEWKGVEARTVREAFRARVGRDPPNYGASYVMAEYDTRQPLPIKELLLGLNSMIGTYKSVLEIAVAEQIATPPKQDLVAAVQSFSASLRAAFISFGPRHERLIRSFVASVLTKPFVILTGLSGSGKTQLAMKFGEWLGLDRLYVSAVRPDWTGPDALLGYEDGLKPAIEGYAVWNVPGVLEFMLRAADDPSQPYVLLLDEMNLAHVERYFADVLSGMESAQPCLPNLIRDVGGNWRLKSV